MKTEECSCFILTAYLVSKKAANWTIYVAALSLPFQVLYIDADELVIGQRVGKQHGNSQVTSTWIALMTTSD